MSLAVASVVLFVTLILGTISKKCTICKKISIPIQNLIIGVLAGVLCYYAGIETNLVSSIILCVISSFSAGGMYDFSKCTKNNNSSNNVSDNSDNSNNSNE